MGRRIGGERPEPALRLQHEVALLFPTMAVDHPYPGEELAWRVTGATSREWFEESGRLSLADLTRALAAVGTTWSSYESALDFGCGCGRILLWMEEMAESVSLHGADIDQRAIQWARQNIPWARFATTSALPPLPYGDGSFDLVFNHSVFTHLDEAYQGAWIDELYRVTKPDATLLLSFHGEYAFRDTVAKQPRLREQLDRDGIVFLREDSWTGGPFPDCYHTTFHAPWYVLERFGRRFEVRAYLARGALGSQDLAVFQRLADGVAPTAYPSARRVAPVWSGQRARRGANGALGTGRAMLRRAAREVRQARALSHRTADRLNRLEGELFAALDQLDTRLKRMEDRG